MRGFFTSFLSKQVPPPGTQEGIPFWTFWLLIFIILLLTVFIFLRDKRLRQNLNTFLFGAKKKLIKFRLKARLKKVRARKEDILKELGKKASEAGIKSSKGEKANKQLLELEEEKNLLNKELKEIISKIMNLRNTLEEYNQSYKTRIIKQEAGKTAAEQKSIELKEKQKHIGYDVIQKQRELERTIKEMNSENKVSREIDKNEETSEKPKKIRYEQSEEKIKNLLTKKEEINREIKDLIKKSHNLDKKRRECQEEIDRYNDEIKKIEEEGKKQNRSFYKEIREWEKNREIIQEKIQKIELQKQPLYETLGRLINEERSDHKELILYYSKIDRKNRRIEEIEKRMKSLD